MALSHGLHEVIIDSRADPASVVLGQFTYRHRS